MKPYGELEFFLNRGDLCKVVGLSDDAYVACLLHGLNGLFRNFREGNIYGQRLASTPPHPHGLGAPGFSKVSPPRPPPCGSVGCGPGPVGQDSPPPPCGFVGCGSGPLVLCCLGLEGARTGRPASQPNQARPGPATPGQPGSRNGRFPIRKYYKMVKNLGQARWNPEITDHTIRGGGGTVNLGHHTIWGGEGGLSTCNLRPYTPNGGSTSVSGLGGPRDS